MLYQRIGNSNMEHCYIIIYDLCNPGQNYQNLYCALRNFPHWGKLTESVWAVVSNKSCAEIRDYLKQWIDTNDRLMVVQSGCNAAWQNMIASNEWIKSNIIK